jgi:hypothetical protein
MLVRSRWGDEDSAYQKAFPFEPPAYRTHGLIKSIIQCSWSCLSLLGVRAHVNKLHKASIVFHQHSATLYTTRWLFYSHSKRVVRSHYLYEYCQDIVVQGIWSWNLSIPSRHAKMVPSHQIVQVYWLWSGNAVHVRISKVIHLSLFTEFLPIMMAIVYDWNENMEAIAAIFSIII